MKTVIVALNSKYIHSSLAPWYLKNICKDLRGNIKVLEYTINDDMEGILSRIFAEKPGVIAFSCYIWNIVEVLKLSSNLKKVLPSALMILGGPEVSFEPEKIMSKNPFIDYIICGEGEFSFKELLITIETTINEKEKIKKFEEVKKIEEIEGLCFKKGGEIIYKGGYCLTENLDLLPSPYSNDMLKKLDNKIVYYESSRGCPFSCSYCLSSTFLGVRYFSLDRVKKDITCLLDAKVKQIKFVDRTFNCNKKRAKEIIKFVIENGKNTNFHFEAAGDLFDEEMLEILSKAKKGLIQFEIGVQSTNERTLMEVGRKTDIENIFKNVKKLISYGNIHIHLDLIAGLPNEDLKSAMESFNRVYELRPHQLQLGFLKILKGTKIRDNAKKYGYCFREYPPYEVLFNNYISFDEIIELKGIEHILDKYYNSKRFINSLNYLIEKKFDSAFDFFKEFYLYNLKAGYLDRALPARSLYTILYEFIKTILHESEHSVMQDLLKFDYLSTNSSGNLPEGIKKIIEIDYKERRLNFLNNKENQAKYFPEFKGTSPKHLLKYVHFTVFENDITNYVLEHDIGKSEKSKIKSNKITILFNYKHKDKVTGVYEFHKIKF